MRTMHANRSHSVRFRQQQNASLPYAVNWGGLHTSAISTSEWTSDGGVNISSQANTDHEATAVLAATPGTYWVTNKVTLADGTVDERTFTLYVSDEYGVYGAARDYVN